MRDAWLWLDEEPAFRSRHPFSKGGSSPTAASVRLLCAKHNLEKSDKILSIAPWVMVEQLVRPR